MENNGGRSLHRRLLSNAVLVSGRRQRRGRILLMRQPLATLSAVAGNGLRQTAAAATVATNATTIRAQAQQAGLVIEEPQPKKFLHGIVINNQPASLNRLPATRLKHSPLNQLGAGKTSPGRSFLFAGSFQHRHTTSLMQELSTKYFSTAEQAESGEEDMAVDVVDGEDGEESEMEEWENEEVQPRSMEDMAEDIRRTPPQKRTEVLSTAVLAEKRKKSPPTCNSHIEQVTVPYLPPPPATTQAITFKSNLSCRLYGNDGHAGKDCAESMHSTNSLRKCTNCQGTGPYSILWTT